MSKWEMVRLGDVGKVLTGNTPKTSDENNYDSQDVCFYKPGDFDENKVKVLENADSYISNYAKEKARLAPEDSVLVTCIGIIGKVGVTTAEVSFNQQINAIIPDNKICDSKYLAYAILKINKHLNDMANSAVVPIINKSQFENIQIQLPPLHVQQKIADILDRANTLIEKRKAQIEKLDLLVKSQFIEMFGDPVTNPKDFPMVKIGDFATKIRSGLSRKLATDDIGLPVIRSTNMINGYLDTTDIKYWYIKDPQGANTSDYILEDGDILVNFINSNEHIGKVCLYKNMGRDCIYTTNIFVMKVDDKCSNVWFSNFAKTNAYKAKLDRIIQPAVNQSSFTTSRFREIEIPLPPVELQMEFADFSKHIEMQKIVLRKSLVLLEQNYKSLMQKCFAGE